MQNTRINAAIALAYGTPAAQRPSAASVVCTSAVTTMPSATARIEAPASTTS